jgi:hypothetical protein
MISLETAVQCLGINLVPVRAFAEHAHFSQLHDTGTIKASAMSKELEVDVQNTHSDPHIDSPPKTENLLSHLRHAMVQQTMGGRDFWFLPHERLLQLVTKETISKALIRIQNATENIQYQNMEDSCLVEQE